jgi:DNA-binding GntR family transcriptional regulator
MSEPIVHTVTGQLIVRLRDRILAGAYAPGSALRQDDLASEFGTSKIPIREALVQLQSEGLVNIFPQKGFRVRPLHAAELQEVFRLRLLIEPTVIAQGAKLATAADHNAASTALAGLNAALIALDFATAENLNRSFHLALIVPRLQPVAMDMLSRLHTLAQRYVQAHLRPDGRNKRATREHTAIFEAWRAGKSKEAGRLVRSHIEDTLEDLERSLSDD